MSISFSLVWVQADPAGAVLTILCCVFFNREEASQVEEAKGDRHSTSEGKWRRSLKQVLICSGIAKENGSGRGWGGLGRAGQGLGEKEDGDLGRMRMRTWGDRSLYS